MSSESAATTHGSPERRYEPRFPYHAGLEIEWGSAILKGFVREISSDGMFIEMEYPLWIGATFQARLALTPPLVLHCVVRRVEPGRGIGASVKTAESGEDTRLKALVSSLSAR